MENDQEGQLDLYCDGSSTNDDGPRSLARWAVAFESGKKVVDVSGLGTNNEAEYKGLIAALNFIMLAPYTSHAAIHIDSELVFMQVMDKFQVKSKRLKPLHELAQKLMATTVTRVDTLELVLETGCENPAHIVVDSVPDVYNGIHGIVDKLPKYEEMLAKYNEHVDAQAALCTEEHGEPDTDRRPFTGEITQEARQWIWEKGMRTIGTLGHMPSHAFVDSLYDAGAESVEVVDPTFGGTGPQSCDALRVKLPFDPNEDLESEGTTADKALACLTIMTELETAKVQQARGEQTVFYVIWEKEKEEV